MNHRKITAISLAVGMLFLAACVKEDITTTYPDPPRDEKVFSVYETSVLRGEIKNIITGEWSVLYERNRERHLVYKLIWNGSFLESLEDHKYDRNYTFEYDENSRVSRIVCDNDTDYSRTLFYDENGRLSRAEGSKTQADGTVFATQTLIYTWENDLLKTIAEDDWSYEPGEGEVTKKVNTVYTWQDGNVTSTKRTVRKDNIIEELQYDYEYSSLLNPLHGSVFFIFQDNGIFFDYAGFDCLSKNLPSCVVSDPSERNEYTYSGTPVTSFERCLYEYGTSLTRLVTNYTVDFVYPSPTL